MARKARPWWRWFELRFSGRVTVLLLLLITGLGWYKVEQMEDAYQRTKCHGEPGHPAEVAATPPKALSKTDPAPAQPPTPAPPEVRPPDPPKPPAWVPNPGDTCELVVPKWLSLNRGERSFYLVARDRLALDRLMKYAEARDGDGCLDLIRKDRVLWFNSPTIPVRVIAIDRRTETAEVRTLVGDGVVKDWDGTSVVRKGYQEGVVLLSQLRKAEE